MGPSKIIALCLLGIPAGIKQDVIAVSAEDIAAKWGPSILFIAVQNNEKTKEGSGFFINETQAITNWHVVRDASEIVVFGKDEIPYKVRVKARLPERDLAILEFDKPAGKGKAMEIRETPAKDLETVYVCGNPKSMRFVWSDGKVGNASQKNIRGECIQITAPISPGSSGGPLLDKDGKVIGVVAGYLPDGQNLNFAIPSKYIFELLAIKASDSDGFDRKIEDRLSEFEKEISSLAPDQLRREVDSLKEQGSHDPYWLGELAVILIQKEFEEAAIPLLLAALEGSPDSARVWANLGLAYYKIGSREKSAQAYRKALDLAPDDEKIVIQSARAYERLGQADRAKQVLQLGLRQHPDWMDCAEALKKIIKK